MRQKRGFPGFCTFTGGARRKPRAIWQFFFPSLWRLLWCTWILSLSPSSVRFPQWLTLTVSAWLSLFCFAAFALTKMYSAEMRSWQVEIVVLWIIWLLALKEESEWRRRIGVWGVAKGGGIFRLFFFHMFTAQVGTGIGGERFLAVVWLQSTLLASFIHFVFVFPANFSVSSSVFVLLLTTPLITPLNGLLREQLCCCSWD